MLIKRVFFFILIGVATISISCVKDVDFDQADDLLLTPVIESNIVYTEQEASRFSDNGIELEEVRDSLANIEIFEEQFVIDNLVRAELIFEVTNSINRTFGMQVDFLNEDDEVQHTFAFDANPSPAGNDIITSYQENFQGNSLDALKATKVIAVTIRLYPSDDGSMLSENSIGRIILKSKGIFYLEIGT